MNAAAPLIGAGVTTLAMTPLVRSVTRRLGYVAKPSVDRWHQTPTALMGGVAIFLGCAAGILVGLATGATRLLGAPYALQVAGILASAILMFATGLIDDVVRFRPATKLVLQFIAAAVLISCGVVYSLTPWVSLNVVITMFWFIGITNALNLLDNMDGVSIGVAGIAAVFLAASFYRKGEPMLAGVAMSLFGAAAGFLPYNFKPASIFMGDSGSLLIGALLAGLSAMFPASAPSSIASVMFVPSLIVALPILDTLLVSTTRTLAGRRVSEGGRDHTSHRLVAMGLSERQTALTMYALAIAGGGVAMIVERAGTDMGLVTGAVFLLALFLGATYLSGLHAYRPEDVREPGRFTVLVSDLLYKRRALEVLLDVTIFAVAYVGAYHLRFEEGIPYSQGALLGKTLAITIVLKLSVFAISGVYRGTWRQLGVADFNRIATALAVAVLATVGALVFFYRSFDFSRSVLILDALLTTLLILGSRITFRSLDQIRSELRASPTRVLVYGAGRMGEAAVRELRANPEFGMVAVGFLDDDPRKHGFRLHGVSVLGGSGRAEALAAESRFDAVILGSPTLRAEGVDAVRSVCARHGLQLLQFRIDIVDLASPAPADAASPTVTYAD